MRNLVILFVFAFWSGIVLFTSCSKEKDNFRAVTGNVDPATIDSANYVVYFPFDAVSYGSGTCSNLFVKGMGLDSLASHIQLVGTKLGAGARGYAYRGDTLQNNSKSYINIPVKTTGSVFLKNLSEFTLSCWVKVSAAGNKSISNIFQVNGGDATFGTLSLTLDSLNLAGSVYNSLTNRIYRDSVSRSSIAGKWSHITLSYNKTTSQLSMYVNGKLLNQVVCYTDASATTPMGILTLSPAMTNVYIGAWAQLISNTQTSSMVYYSGYLDELRMWNKSLSDDEVSALYQAESVLTTIK
ncbi:MAG: LamG domain-containing protein [Bacteroidota bacterium]|nr:LamG domain-containing protein [Bacteroidota bacterium]